MLGVGNHRTLVSGLQIDIFKSFGTIAWLPADRIAIIVFVEFYIQLCGNAPPPVTDPHICSVLPDERDIVEIILVSDKWLEHMNDGTVLKILGALAQHIRDSEDVLLNPVHKCAYRFGEFRGLLALRRTR